MAPRLLHKFVGVICAGVVVQAVAVSSQQSTLTAFDRYSSGAFAESVKAILRNRTIGKVASEFRRDASAWIEGAAPADRRKRTEVVAALTVEFLDASFAQDIVEYRHARWLMEWACERLRQQSPTEFERRFYLASMALIHGARDEDLGGASRSNGMGFAPEHWHSAHAASRFPDEGRFKLAKVTIRRETQYLATWPLAPGYLMAFTSSFTDRVAYLHTLDETERMLDALSTDPAVGVEATLRAGIVRLLRGKPDDARPALTSVAASQEIRFAYVAHLVLGALAERSKAPDEAGRHYRAAHALVPASTSSIALASVLYRAGETASAADVLQSYERGTAPSDPWFAYSRRDFPRWEEFGAAMRSAVAPRSTVVSQPAPSARNMLIGDEDGPEESSADAEPLDITMVVPEYRWHSFEDPRTFAREIDSVARTATSADRLLVLFAREDQRPVTTSAAIAAARPERLELTCVPLYDTIARALMRPVESGRQAVVIAIAAHEGSGGFLGADAVREIAQRSPATLHMVAMQVDPRTYRVVSISSCAEPTYDWSAQHRSDLRRLESISDPDEERQKTWLFQKARLVDLAKESGGDEIRQTMLTTSATRPLREAIERIRTGR